MITNSNTETLILHFDCRGLRGSQNVSYSENFDPSYNLVGARYYDADVGVWTSVDPMRQFWSGYSYTGNGYNPVNGLDPDGNCFGTITDYVCPDAVLKARKTHYERNKHNKAPNNLDKAAQKGKVLSPGKSIYHMGGKNGWQNVKVTFEDGSEGVYNSTTGELDNSAGNMGTYNFIDGDVSAGGHFFMDMIPYWIWGNTPDDPTSLPDRIYPAGRWLDEPNGQVDVGDITIEDG